ncbi:MAG: carbohydrate ABC transporter permease [Lachnospiraceae bacterium]|nr:carbohydrate ABC transporter permease [Lachnospiraceae bacterium]
MADRNKTPKPKKQVTRDPADMVMSTVTYIVYTFFAFVCVYPFYYIFINTISSNDLSARGKITFWPKEIHFTNYINVSHIPSLMNAFRISLSRTVIGALCTVVASAFLGYMFTRETMWLRKVWYRIVVATMYFNAGIIPFFITMKNIGLYNSFWVYILPTIVSPFYVVLCKTFVESVPKELTDAAELDGAGTMRTFISVIVPVIKPILATVAIFSAVAQWNSFQDTLLLVSDPKLSTLQFTLYQYINQASSLKALVNSTTSGASLAASLAHAATATSIRMTVTIVVVAPILLVYPIFQRYFVRGIMIGAVKG